MASLTRRGFVGLVASTAALVGLGAGANALDGGQELLRPPGGQSGALFHALCLRCDRCRSICPTGVIDLATVEDSFLSARTPIMNYHRGDCDYCGKCQSVCPTGALGSFEPENDKIGVAVVRSDRCVAYSSGGCTKCYEVCPYEAITLNDSNHPLVDAEVCNGCGVCEYACPSLVFLAFQGGTRRGIKVETQSTYEAYGSVTTVDEGGED